MTTLKRKLISVPIRLVQNSLGICNDEITHKSYSLLSLHLVESITHKIPGFKLCKLSANM